MTSLSFNPYEEFGVFETVRLVIYDGVSKSFIEKIIIPPYEKFDLKINNKYKIKELKYKYQLKKGDVWEDSQYGYQKFNKFTAKDLLNYLDFEYEGAIQNNILEQASGSEVEYCFRHLLLKTYSFLLSNPDQKKIEIVNRHLKKFPPFFLEEHCVASHYFSLISYLVVFITKFNFKVPVSMDEHIIIEYLNEIDSIFDEEKEVNTGFKTGRLLAKANILSIVNRDLAYKYFQKILEIGGGFIDNFLTIEAITTYYKVVNGKNTSYSIQDMNECINNKNINICFSTDASYFKMFASNWAQASLYFKNLNLNFGIVASNYDEFNILVEDYKRLLKELSNFTNLEELNNTRFFYIKSTVINKTVYACARFYLALHLLEKYDGDVFISDIDQFVVGDLETYLEKISKNKLNIYQPKMRNFYSILPGRSHLAGNIYIRNNAIGKEYSQLLVDYVGMGLQEKFSWMLDQNATRYASEMIPVGDLNKLGERVLRQFPSLKRAYRKI